MRNTSEPGRKTTRRPAPTPYGGGFDFLRLGLALAIFLWHTVLSSQGLQLDEQLFRSPLRLIVVLLVPAFFCLSGYLVTGSYLARGRLPLFLLHRAMRIYPALLLDVLWSALLLGPLTTRLPLGDYFTSPIFSHYLHTAAGFVHFTLPGVFENLPFPKIVNAQLWTIPIELDCYALLAAAILSGLVKRRRGATALFVLANLFVLGGTLAGSIPTAPTRPGPAMVTLSFAAGCLARLHLDRLPDGRRLTLTALGALAVAMLLALHPVTLVLAPAPLAYAVAAMRSLPLPPLRRYLPGDYSYGIFLYGFSLQQFAGWLLGPGFTWYQQLPLALAMTLGFAAFSWHAVESPILRHRDRIVMELLRRASGACRTKQGRTMHGPPPGPRSSHPT